MEPSSEAQPAPAGDEPEIPKGDKEKRGGLFSFGKKKEEKEAEEKPDKPPNVPYRQLFRYTTRKERAYMFIAAVAASIHGALLPLFTIFFGEIINSFGPDTTDVVGTIGGFAKWFLILGAIAFFASLVQVRFQLIVAQQSCARMRRKFFSSVLTQDYTWIDSNDGGELTSRVANDVNLIQAGIGDKLTVAIQMGFTFLTGIVIAFVYGPLLTLVILAVAPLLMIGGAVLGKLATDSTGDGLGAYGSAGAVASEVLGLIRIVTAYNGQKSEITRYDAELERAYKSNVKMTLFTAIGLGFTMFIMFCSYAIAFWFGGLQVRQDKMEAGDVLVTFFAVIIGCFSLGQAAPSFQAFAVAQGAAPRIFDVIERQSNINPLDENTGDTIPAFKGHIRFSNVDFAYKMVDSQSGSVDEQGSTKDPDADDPNSATKSANTSSEYDGETRKFILNNFELDVPPGTSQALVGPSGCGKSTTVRLIERFYDTNNGAVMLDGVDVRTLNVRWMRSQMGYVGQMPTLFMMSIRDNIALGAAMEPVTDKNTGAVVLQRKEVTDDQIISAAKMANAHDFIMRLPEQYDTMLGERGALLSGGQKQRVCIARALVRDPKILILDESTAALDAQSERIVQQALEKASSGRTTITIAHRLSTVRNADVISVIDSGTVVESGKHQELMAIEDGAYRKLIENQNVEALKAENVTGVEKSAEETKPSDAAGEAKVFTESLTKTQKVDEQNDETDDLPAMESGIWMRTFLMNTSELPLIILGILGALAAGAAFPVMAIVFSEVLEEMLNDNDPGTIGRFSLIFVGIGVGAFFGNFFQYFMLGVSGERLTKKIRGLVFRALMKQEMGFFDAKENALGALTTRLATESNLVKGITGDTLGLLSFAVGSTTAGLLVSYIGCWRIALVVTGMFPLMAIAGAFQMKVVAGFDTDSDKKYMQAGAIASEAVDNFDTLTSVGAQDVFIDKYNEELQAPIANGRRTALVAGMAFGVSEFFSQALWAVSFWVGAVFVNNGQCSFPELMKGISGLLFAGMMFGNVSAQMPDLAKSRIAATKIFRLLDRNSSIDPTNTGGDQTEVVGNVELKAVEFKYPTRPDVPVLRKLSVAIGQGKTLALVGASGCGKSTVVSLLERFYDPHSGSINVDGTEVKQYNVNHLRGSMSLVSQEPDLFNRSVRDNIAYGLPHKPGTVVTDDILISAAKEANAHSFIETLPEGYETIVGPRGNRLSGGQRQRVAIARAIVGSPRLLLLDEATSALDAVSERVVQEALDKAGSGRTTIAIAHRLSTIKNADAIAVVSKGKIVEIGTHDQLLRIKDGEYAALVKNQLAGNEES